MAKKIHDQTPVQATMTAVIAAPSSRTSRSTATPTPTKGQTPPLKPTAPPLEPLRWGRWPSQQTPVVVAGQRGKWAFVGPWACGSWEAVLLVAWKERTSTTADRHVVPAAQVLVPITAAPKGRRHAS